VGIFGSANSDRVLKLIALFRLGKALLLILAGFGALQLLRPEVAARVIEWMRAYPFAMRALRSSHDIELIAAATFAYAALFATEGIGLWLEKRWAEYLTIIATTSFIPFEFWEIVKKVTVVRVALVVTNIAIVIYLVWRLARQHRFRRIAS
jgi:uncharacterized membrane protein (DUF2068 family)